MNKLKNNKEQDDILEYIVKLSNEKEYSVKDTGLTYRIINNWSEKGLINHFRNNKSNWHKLSFLELFEIIIYKELKELGVSIKNLKKLKEFLNNVIYDKNKIRIENTNFILNPFHLGIIQTIMGENNLLKINLNFNNIFICSERSLIDFIIDDSNKYGNELYNNTNSFIIISFRNILQVLGVYYIKNEDKTNKLIQEILDSELKELSEDINIKINNGEIIKSKKIEYRDTKPIDRINDLINKPNQKTTFHSNEKGVHSIHIESDIK